MRLLQGEFGEGAIIRVDAVPTGELTFTPRDASDAPVVVEPELVPS